MSDEYQLRKDIDRLYALVNRMGISVDGVQFNDGSNLPNISDGESTGTLDAILNHYDLKSVGEKFDEVLSQLERSNALTLGLGVFSIIDGDLIVEFPPLIENIFSIEDGDLIVELDKEENTEYKIIDKDLYYEEDI